MRLGGCGVCASSLPVWEGRPWFSYPLEPGEPGHEGWGVVEELGPGTDAPEPGTRVAVLSERAFAEYVAVPAGDVLELRDGIAGPFPGEALGCAINVFRRSRIGGGTTVAVVGVGFLGALVVQLASATGARVTALSRRLFALEIAARCGAHRTATLADPPAEEFEVVVETAGAQEALDVATRLVGVRSRLVVAGFHQDGPRTVDLQRWNWQGIDVVNAHERDPAIVRRGVAEAVEAVADGRLDPEPLITHRFPLERLADAFEAARLRPDGFLKAVVVT